MSLAIDTEKVARVLLADGWHDCASVTDDGCSSFYLDAYEYVEGDDRSYMPLAGGAERLIPATGFCFIDAATSEYIFGPVTSVLAVKTSKS